MSVPPFMSKMCPVMNAACGEHRNHAPSAISSGVPRRFKGTFSAITGHDSLGIMVPCTGPGATPFTRIP